MKFEIRNALPLILPLIPSISAQSIVDSLSFGHKDRVAPVDAAGIPGWQISSSKHNIQILSDRAILTPPYPANARGALWTDRSIDTNTWTAEVEFRASGQETGSGNLNFWFVKDKTPIFIDNLYTVERFDGLNVVIDQYGGTGGKVRGFLNDGTQNFKSHTNLESLAFGHCDYRYRNLGRPSKLKVTSNNGLTVSIDDKECFSTNRVTLPSGYYFGLTAATGEEPDSFEVNKFVVSSGVSPASPPPIQQQQNQQNQQAQTPKVPQLQKLDRLPGAPELIPDKAPTEITKQEDQFADLHNRLQTVSHQVAMVFAELEELGRKVDAISIPSSHVAGGSGTASGDGISGGQLDALARRAASTENMLEHIRRGQEDLTHSVDALKQKVESVNHQEHFSHLADSMEHVIERIPKMGFFVFMVVAVQMGLAGAYVVYKRRRGGMPKKYL